MVGTSAGVAGRMRGGIGGSLPGYEEGEQVRGLLRDALGHRGVFAAKAVVRHPARRTYGELSRKAVRVMGGVRDGRVAKGRATFTPADVRRGLQPPVKRLLRQARATEPGGLRARAGALGVVLFWHYSCFAAKIRLERGAASAR